jgi:hypothetical protein
MCCHYNYDSANLVAAVAEAVEVAVVGAVLLTTTMMLLLFLVVDEILIRSAAEAVTLLAIVMMMMMMMMMLQPSLKVGTINLLLVVTVAVYEQVVVLVP